MAYIGTDINYGNIAKQTGTGDGSDTTPIAALTYTVPSNESILVFLDGVAQVPGTDFTATGTTLTFTTAPASGVAILVMFLGRSLDIGTPGDGTVSLAKMAANSVDSSAYVDGSVDLIHMSSESVDEDNLHISNSGSNGEFLSKQSGDAGGLTWAAAGGGAWTMLASGTQVASASASLTVTGLDSTYDTYALVGADLKPASDCQVLYLRFGDSGGVDSGASDYSYYHMNVGTGDAGAPHAASNDNSESYIKIGHCVGNATGEGAGFLMYLHRPGDGTSYPMVSGTTANQDNSTNVTGGWGIGQREAVITLDRVQVLFASGNITSGRFTVYGIKHT